MIYYQKPMNHTLKTYKKTCKSLLKNLKVWMIYLFHDSEMGLMQIKSVTLQNQISINLF